MYACNFVFERPTKYEVKYFEVHILEEEDNVSAHIAVDVTCRRSVICSRRRGPGEKIGLSGIQMQADILMKRHLQLT